MSTLFLPERGGFPDDMAYLLACMDEIDRNSYEDVFEAIKEFSFTGTHTERRTINAGTATLAELRDYVVTLVNDIKKQGSKRSYAT
jgi:hypothetical protein